MNNGGFKSFIKTKELLIMIEEGGNLMLLSSQVKKRDFEITRFQETMINMFEKSTNEYENDYQRYIFYF